MEEYNEEYGTYDDDDSDSKTNPQWRTLSPKERKLLMKNVEPTMPEKSNKGLITHSRCR